MRILIADNEVCRVLNSQILSTLAKYGSVDIVKNGRAAVLAYVNAGSRDAFYDQIILDQNLTVLDGFETVEMIRFYELEHRKYGKRTMICVISDGASCHQQHEVRYGLDERTHLVQKPVNDDLIMSLAASVAAECEINSNSNHVPMSKRQLSSSSVWEYAQ